MMKLMTSLAVPAMAIGVRVIGWKAYWVMENCKSAVPVQVADAGWPEAT